MREMALGALTALALFGGAFMLISPSMYYIGKWHCYWHQHAPVCQ